MKQTTYGDGERFWEPPGCPVRGGFFAFKRTYRHVTGLHLMRGDCRTYQVCFISDSRGQFFRHRHKQISLRLKVWGGCIVVIKKVSEQGIVEAEEAILAPLQCTFPDTSRCCPSSK